MGVMNIRDRIKELRRVKASELAPNPLNWRTHSKAQGDVLRGLLAEVGFAGAVLARELPDGSLQLIDGHLRAETVGGDTEIPVLVLDVSADEAAKILATYDPLGAMAGSDAAKLDELLRGVQTGNEAVASLIEQTLTAAGGMPDVDEPAGVDIVPERFQILIEFDTEAEQAEALDRLSAEGFKCRSLIS